MSTNLTLYRTALRQKLVAMSAYTLSGLALVELYAAMFPSLQSQAATNQQLLTTLPPALIKAFGIESSGLGNLTDFLASKHFGLVWPLMMMFLAVSLAGWMLAGEVEKRTLGLWLAAPVSRSQVFWTRYAAAATVLAVFCLGSITVTIPAAAALNLAIDARPILEFTGAGFLMGLAVFSLTLLVSAMASEKGRVYAYASATLLVMYVLNLVASLNTDLVDFKYTSLFYYLDVAGVLAGHGLDWLSYAVFSVLIIGGSALAAVRFIRRDISI